MEQKLFEASPYIFLLYVLIKEFSPVLKSILEKIVPSLVRKTKQAEKFAQEMKEKELDLEERTVVTQEKMTQALILIQSSQEHFAETLQHLFMQLDVLSRNVSVANTNISILLDRSIRLRRDDDNKKM